MLISNNNDYTNIDDPIKTESTQSSLSRKDSCIYLIGIITGSLLLLLLFLFGGKQIGMDSIYNNNNIINNNQNNHELNVESDDSVSVSTLTTTTNVLFVNLTVGNVVKLSMFESKQVLKNPSNHNRIKNVPNSDSHRVKWIVGYSNWRDAYSFKNVEQGCYLQHKDNELKCLSDLYSRSFWKANAGTQKTKGIKYQRLKNYANNKCPNIDKKDLNEIGMTKQACGFADSLVEILRYD